MKGPLKLIVPLAAALGVAACSAGGSSSVPSVSGVAGLSAAHVPQWALSHTIDPRLRREPRRSGPMRRPDPNKLESRRFTEPMRAGAPRISRRPTICLRPLAARARSSASLTPTITPTSSATSTPIAPAWAFRQRRCNKYNQTGQQSNYPQGSPNWGVEIDLDVDMVSASLSELQSYPRRGELQRLERPRGLRSRGYQARRDDRQQQLRRHRRLASLSTKLRASPISPARATAAMVSTTRRPSKTSSRSAAPSSATTPASAATTRSSGRLRAAAAPTRKKPSPRGKRIPSARSARVATSARSPAMRPSTIPTTPAAGSRSQAPASPRRSWPAWSRSRATPRSRPAVRTSGSSRRRNSRRTSIR